jgi:hypothetical protein
MFVQKGIAAGLHLTANRLLNIAMHSGVACRAQSNQVLLRVGSRMAAELPVVYLKIRHRATGLTPPTVTIQDLLA